jgi:16S rRNA (cytosine1402-N4)-methyltransferase
VGFSHRTVLLEETVSLLAPGKDRVIVDGTLGGGGHTEGLLAAGATVLGIDRDPAALEAARTRLAGFGDRFRAVEGTFGELESLIDGPVDGVLLDLGVSSPQLDSPERGFSFQADGPLDMRMGRDGETAAELIARLDEAELADVLWQLGEERFSRQIARALKAKAPTTTLEAAEAVKAAVPRKAWPDGVHVATKTFQALRIAVNHELEQLDTVLEALPRLLKPHGRAAIISFHSLEDRKVKQAFKALCGGQDEGGNAQLKAIRQHQGARSAEPTFRALTRKAITAGEAELAQNLRARSAHLRGVEKVS